MASDPDRGVPVVYNVHRLDAEAKSWVHGRGTQVLMSPGDGRWFRARPAGYHGICLRARLRIAWRVFTGEYDALSWTLPTPPAEAPAHD